MGLDDDDLSILEGCDLCTVQYLNLRKSRRSIRIELPRRAGTEGDRNASYLEAAETEY